MRTYNVSSFVLNIWVQEGIYCFPPESATGKTYLCKLLDMVNSDDKILTVSYDLYKKGLPVEKLLTENDYDLVVLDRFDMYQSRSLNRLLGKLSYSTTILVDIKGELMGCGGVIADCYVELYRDKIEVLPI